MQGNKGNVNVPRSIIMPMPIGFRYNINAEPEYFVKNSIVKYNILDNTDETLFLLLLYSLKITFIMS